MGTRRNRRRIERDRERERGVPIENEGGQPGGERERER
jgi:predicted DNA-binding transcriptional regulator YafY